jgi:hypothetical protein
LAIAVTVGAAAAALDLDSMQDDNAIPLSTFGHGLPNQTTGHGLRERESKGRSQDKSWSLSFGVIIIMVGSSGRPDEDVAVVDHW